MASEPYAYPGDELDLFAEAHHWKAYWSGRIRKYLQGDVLEVGAGIGANTALLRDDSHSRWVCVEPDDVLAARLRASTGRGVDCVTGTIESVSPNEQFDTILYIDVLEHIENHTGEVAKAAGYLKPGGHLVMLGPAHDFLMSPFDEHVGHVRRYSRGNIPEVDASVLRLVHTEYLDSVGMCASLANRVLLRASLPSRGQIATWDRFMVPLSRVIDPLTGRNLGKSILAVWRRV